MGEGPDGGGAFGRRRAHPHGAVPGPGEPGTRFEALLGAALRDGGVDAAAEQRAVAAFVAAREAGAHRARTRRRDDWRPRRRPPARTVRTTLAVLLASLTAGGVAVATIGAPGPSGPPSATASPSSGQAGREDRPTAPQAGSGSAAPAPSRTALPAPDRPATARDTEAHCRAYGQVAGSGRSPDATAWQRLAAAAGGAEHVEAYCAELLTRAGAEESPAAVGSAAAGGPAARRGPGAEESPAAAGGRPDDDPGRAEERSRKK
ncbi:hypothetical protein [Streptomyces cinereospinus]|uniref:hypothetical protein n=1 Tax=Streptomyces cinereospinus TaxID=285561 RepID=UPI00361198BA